ncbi:MAG: hypothetical protein LBH43_15930 [Treponema sp.]|jgi:hypothetical protein|nr:hypothetical protein [Treponema sp.]
MWEENLAEYCYSRNEGILALADRHTRLLNETLLFLKEMEFATDMDDFELAVSWYIDNPLLEWNEDYFGHFVSPDYENPEMAITELLSHYYREKTIKENIALLLPFADMAAKSSAVIESELKIASDSLAQAREVCDSLALEYQKTADKFRLAGETYDALYSAVELAFANREDARRSLETQDAIKLWADTAYLDIRNPVEELRYCKEKTSLAFNALEVVKTFCPDDYTSRDAEYLIAVAEYQNTLSLLTLSLDALNKLGLSIGEEREKNQAAYLAYQRRLSAFGQSITYEKGYTSPANRKDWDVKDMVTVENGFLVFAKNSDMVISGSDAERSAMLDEYFSRNIAVGNEPYPVSAFEQALRELGNYFFSMNLTMQDYQKLALARDFLIRNIKEKNPGLDNIGSWYRTAESLRDNNLGALAVPGSLDTIHRIADAGTPVVTAIQINAWNSLDQKTKNALEFYTILTLLGYGGNDSGGFSRMTEYMEYYMVYNYVNDIYIEKKKNAGKFLIGGLYKNSLQKATLARDSVSRPLERVYALTTQSYYGLNNTVDSLNKTLSTYRTSSNKLALLEGGSDNIDNWEKIKRALKQTAGFDGDMDSLEAIWERIRDEAESSDILSALNILAEECRYLHEDSSYNLFEVWKASDNQRAVNEAAYRELYNAYMAGRADLNDLRAAASLCYGGQFPSGKEYLENIGNALMKSLAEFTMLGLSGTRDGSILAGKYINTISSAWENKYNSEFRVRLNEWELQKKDIQEKRDRWRESAAIILEQGRVAWKEGDEKLREACNMWTKTFQEEYERVNAGWTAAYLEGLQDKETWAAFCLDAAGRASSAAFFVLIGSDAEAGARAMDTRDPIGFMNVPDIREGDRILGDLLERSGTANLSAVFNSIRGSGDTFATAVRTGLGAAGIWNSPSALTEASALARTVRDDFEKRESQKIAYMAMMTVRDAYNQLEENVAAANRNARENFDETFIMRGQWQKSGGGYKKNVLVHSTLFNAVITDEAATEGYRSFLFPKTRLTSYLDADLPQNMSIYQAEAYIDSINSEIQELCILIFGKQGNHKQGKFYIHVGDPPVTKSPPDVDKGREGIIDVPGTGETGRLLTEFYYWMLMEQKGIHSMSLAPWEKPLWDSRGSSIQAPSLKSAVTIAVQTGLTIAGAFTGGTTVLGSIALNAVLGSATELAFTTMDVAGWYKTWQDAGLNFGKTLLTNTVSSAAGAVFNGVANASNSFFNSGGINGIINNSKGFGNIALNTLSTGVQTFSTGTVNSLIGAVTFDDSGFGFSKDSFTAGLRNAGIGTLTGMTGTFTTGTLNLGIEGFVNNLTSGKLYFTNGQKLSGLLGGLASQGVNYAFGNDFTLNILNIADFLGKDSKKSAGLVEMHLGKNGLNFQLGSGGADASVKTLISAAKGLEAWKVNASLLFSGQDAAMEFASQMRTLYSMEGTNRELYGSILAGKTLVERTGRRETETVLNKNTGNKTILLGTDAFSSGGYYDLNVVFSHEAYRDGIKKSEQEMLDERDRAVIGHMLTEKALVDTYGKGILGAWMSIEAAIFNAAMDSGNYETLWAIVKNYDASGSFWKLLPNGNIAYDGLASLSDSNGRTIISAESMKLKETQIEGALVKILGFDLNDKEAVEWVRNLMDNSGLIHSFNADAEQWYWRGTYDVRSWDSDGNIIRGTYNLDELNMGKAISLSQISMTYKLMGNNSGAINKFINGVYGDPIQFLNHNDTNPALWMLSAVYNETQMQHILANRDWLNNVMNNGVDTDSMIKGNVKRTEEFGVESKMMKLLTSAVENAAYFWEIHTGIDYGAGGTSINVPGGYWIFTGGDDHKAYYQLFGSSLNMRIQHIDPDQIKKLVPNTVYGGDTAKLLDYPTQSYGSGTGAHVHIDMTMRLPYENYYTRQFVNPNTMKPGNTLNYSYKYYDANENLLKNLFFNRF